MKVYPLDKILEVGTLYTMEMNRGYVIRKVATDSTSRATLEVDGAPVLEVVKDICPLYPELKNLNPALELGDLYIVVEPKEKLSFTGSAGSKMRIVGEIFELAAGETVPGGLDARHEEQTKKYLTYLTGLVTVAAETAIPKGTATTIIDTEVGAGRKYLINREYMAEGRLDNLVNVPNFFSRIAINEKELDILTREAGYFGIAGQSAPNPPRHLDTAGAVVLVEKKAYSLKDFPIELVPGDRLKVILSNETADYTVPTGKTLNLISHVVAVYEKVKAT